jgi:hypothetical protein
VARANIDPSQQHYQPRNTLSRTWTHHPAPPHSKPTPGRTTLARNSERVPQRGGTKGELRLGPCSNGHVGSRAWASSTSRLRAPRPRRLRTTASRRHPCRREPGPQTCARTRQRPPPVEERGQVVKKGDVTLGLIVGWRQSGHVQSARTRHVRAAKY